MRPRLAVVLDRHLTVDEDRAVAARALDAPPLAARDVVRDLDREALELLEVVDDDIGRCAFDQRAPIAEAGAVRGECREPPVGGSW